MKKSKALLVMIIIFALCLSVCALTACDSHKHDFSNEVVEEEFIATEASCEQRATYYKSCSCGKKGTETFEYGDYKHNFGRDIVCDDCGYTKPTQGLEYKLNSDKQSYYVNGLGSATSKEIVIAPTYNDLPVTAIGEGAFSGKNNLTSLTIPDSITRIEKNAFRYCSMEIKWGKNPTIETIGEYAFNAYSGSSIVIPSSVTTIEAYGFSKCNFLVNIAIPSSLTSIGENAFMEAAVSNIFIEDLNAWCRISGLTYLMSNMFCRKSLYLGNDLVTEVVIGEGIENIPDFAFASCLYLTKVTIEDNVKSIGINAFNSCDKIKSATIGNGVQSIGMAAFSQCVNMTNVIIGNGVKSIGGFAFFGCTKLVNVTFGENIESLGELAFYCCSNLTSVTLPKTLNYIEKDVFTECSSLTSITFENTEGWWLARQIEETSGESVDVSNPTENVKLLTDTFRDFFWHRG